MVNPAKLRRRPPTRASSAFLMKQRVRRYYSHFKEYQFRRLFIRARKIQRYTKSAVFFHFFKLLERRLDAFLVRLGFFSMKTVRQLILHGFVLVNGVVVNFLGKMINSVGILLLLGDMLFFERIILRKLRRARVISKIFKKLPLRFSIPFASFYMVPHFQFDVRTFRILVGDFPVVADELYYPFVFQMHKFLALYQPIK
jgi:hypothetical protein